MPQLARGRDVCAAVAVGALGLASLTLAGGGAQAAAAPRVTIASTHPVWAVPARRASSREVTRGTVRARVYLAARDPARLAALATAESTPGNPSYRHFLRPAQIQDRFGVPAARLDAIRAWLTKSGLDVTGVSDHVADGYVAVRGPVAAASRAFGVRFAGYRLRGQGVVRAPQQAASVPAAVAGSVLAIAGLSTARQTMRPAAVRPAAVHPAAVHPAAVHPAAVQARAVRPLAAAKLPPPGPNFWVARPCGSSYNQKIALSKPAAYGRHRPWAVCGYMPRQVRRAYGVTASGMTGAGQTVAIVDAFASPTMLSDANAYARVVGDQPFARGQYQQYLPASFTGAAANMCDAQGWYGEQTLDVESAHGMAPAARVRYVAAASCTDPALADALARIVNNHLASIISNSWGDTEDSTAGFTDVYHLILQTAAAEGIAVMFSSGDSGYESPGEDPGLSDKIQVDYPTSDSWVTSVGGTSLAIGKNRNYMFETAWGTIRDPLAASGQSWQYKLPGPYPAGFAGGSGGGTSTLFAQPGYQQGVVPARLSQRLPDGSKSATPMRVVPDVSAYADPATGFLIGQTVLEPNGKTYRFALSRIGGTSLSSPTFAGIEADAQQAAGGPLGFANPAIYHRYGTPAFHDVIGQPLGPTPLAQVRPDYTDPTTKGGPLIYHLRTLGIDGEGAAALRATSGYDDATGVGSPKAYVQSFGKV
jgi:subtilase family serine protease